VIDHNLLDSIMLRPSFVRMTVKQTWWERLRWWGPKHKVNGDLVAPRGRR
jgi:hypothetical protein